MGHAEVEVEEVEELDDDESVFVLSGSELAVGKLKGLDQLPVHPGGGNTIGVMPPIMPTSAGGQPLMIPPNRIFHMFNVPPHRE
jgi:hypothetical protein